MAFKELLSLVSTKNPPRISSDSRLVQKGDIFVALKGTVYDGHDFIDQAIANGAKYIVCQKNRIQKTEYRRQKKYDTIFVEDSAEAAAILAQTRVGNPATQLTNLAVTGTNGKTTVAFLVRSIIQNAGQRCGLIGTIVYDTGQACSQADLTTPDCLAIADTQQQMVKASSRYMVIEASSHALSQNRLAGIKFKAAAFTNLAGDHLDYHKTKEHYLNAKTRLFSSLSTDATAVLNKQSHEANLIAEQTSAKILWYAVDEPAPLKDQTEAEPAPFADSLLTEPADLTAHIESIDITGTIFTLKYAGQSSIVKTSLLGRHNISNHLAAAGLCLAADFDLDTIAAGLSALNTIPGRLEKLDGDGFSVFIDYAHTDDALKNVLSSLKPFCKGRLIVVFGCGGDRDRTKRPRMARVAEQLADFVIVTSDNPRTERPGDIIDEIIDGFENPDSQTIIVQTDRKKAIEFAIRNAVKGDVVLIAGKGHETYQIIGTQKIDFDDKKVAQKCLKKRRNNSRNRIGRKVKAMD